MSNWPALVGLFVLGALAGREALLDKTPRSPRREWWAALAQRPEMPFWAKRRSKREIAGVSVSIGEKAS